MNFSFPNQVFPKSPRNVDYIKSSIRESLKKWEEHVKDVTFRETDDINADIMLSFQRADHGDNYALDGPGGIYGNLIIVLTIPSNNINSLICL